MELLINIATVLIGFGFLFFIFYLIFKEKKEKRRLRQNEDKIWQERLEQIDIIKQKISRKAPEIRDLIYKEGYGSILKKFVNKYSTNNYDYGNNELSKIDRLLSSKGIDLIIVSQEEYDLLLRYDTETFSLLREILKIEEKVVMMEKDKHQYDQLKKIIEYNKPKNLSAYIKEFIIHFDQSDTHEDYARLLRLLNENGISHTDDQMHELLQKAREEVEIRAFEENLSNPEAIYIIDEIDIMSGEAFESCLSDLYEKMGYSVESTPATGDQGADLIVTKIGIKSIIQAKRYSTSVGNKAVQEVIAALNYYQGDKAIVITNNYFTKHAVELAQSASVDLIDRDKLISLLEKFY
jgi:hypothetical protein